MKLFVVTIGPKIEGVFKDPRKAADFLFFRTQERNKQLPGWDVSIGIKKMFRAWLESDQTQILDFGGNSLKPTQLTNHDL
jgi:hypothetical protein